MFIVWLVSSIALCLSPILDGRTVAQRIADDALAGVRR